MTHQKPQQANHRELPCPYNFHFLAESDRYVVEKHDCWVDRQSDEEIIIYSVWSAPQDAKENIFAAILWSTKPRLLVLIDTVPAEDIQVVGNAGQFIRGNLQRHLHFPSAVSTREIEAEDRRYCRQ